MSGGRSSRFSAWRRLSLLDDRDDDRDNVGSAPGGPCAGEGLPNLSGNSPGGICFCGKGVRVSRIPALLHWGNRFIDRLPDALPRRLRLVSAKAAAIPALYDLLRDRLGEDHTLSAQVRRGCGAGRGPLGLQSL